MALTPRNERHAARIEAGTEGRRAGHSFEEQLAILLNEIDPAELEWPPNESHQVVGNPAVSLLQYVVAHRGLDDVSSVRAWAGGGLATGSDLEELGLSDLDVLRDPEGNRVTETKSDVVVEIEHRSGVFRGGVSVKTCNASKPTNAQLYFTTASAFCALLRRHGIDVSDVAERGLRMFCGDEGFRPIDDPDLSPCEPSHKRGERWYWDEMPEVAIAEWGTLLDERQDEVTRILLQKGYRDDPYEPKYLLHQQQKYEDGLENFPAAIFAMEEFIEFSRQYQGFATRGYRPRGEDKSHVAPRFGYIQFQRAGNVQHPTQLQFNLKAGYFNKLPD